MNIHTQNISKSAINMGHLQCLYAHFYFLACEKFLDSMFF